MTTAILLLAGLDPTGGAGLLADAATARARGCRPLGVPSMLTVQNSIRFESAEPVAPAHIERAVAALAAEFSFDTAKVGLVPAADATWLKAVGAVLRRRCRRIVADPVLRPAAAAKGTAPGAAYLSLLSGAVVTPNLRELALLAAAAGVKESDIAAIARSLARRLDAAIVVTFEGTESRVLVAEKDRSTDVPITLLPTERPVHGTGCRFSTAVACSLALGKPLPDAVADAAAHLTEALRLRERFHPDGQDFTVF